ncbi:MAG: DNA polymerase III subunit delta [Chloroflexi bacterium 13_1_40CM_3_65_12]|nr:MAG: DNA polymerase III subunit delta [Chloroflexi bacterium 13_1_40CM_3_65_12]
MAKPTTPATILLLHGEERFLVEDKARTTLEAWRSELVSDFGFDRLEGQGLSAARLQDSVLQAPFLDPFRVVAVTMVPAARAEGLASALVEVPTSTKLLITVAGRLGGGNRLAKSVAAAGGNVEEMLHLKGRALSEWAARRATDHGLSAAVAAQVVRVTPADLKVIDSELSKLAAYKASGSKLTAEVVTELLAGGREDEIFKLTDNLLPHPTPEALKIARGLSSGGMQPTSVAWRMARHVALVLEVRARQDRGESLSDVKSQMAEHPFVVQKAFETARDADPDQLEAVLRAIRDYEWEVKSGQIDPELGLDVLLTRL